jgi:hypothetical protein
MPLDAIVKARPMARFEPFCAGTRVFPSIPVSQLNLGCIPDGIPLNCSRVLKFKYKEISHDT